MVKLMQQPVNTAALALLTYKVAEFLGTDAALVQLLVAAAETGDPAVAAQAYQAFLELPTRERRALANWLSKQLQQPLVPAYPSLGALFSVRGVQSKHS